MEKELSLTKIFMAIFGFIVLLHLKEIYSVIGNIYEWFAESLEFMRHFPRDAQAAIAFLTIILVIVLVVKTINKQF
jgi:hypothetical protein